VECEAARFILDRYLENQLSPLQKTKLEVHLAACPACTREVSHHHEYRRLLEGYFGAVTAPDGFSEETMLRLDRPASAVRRRPPTEVGPVLVEPPRRRFGSGALVGSAALLAALAVGLLVWSKVRTAPETGVRVLQGAASVRLPGSSEWVGAAAEQRMPPASAVRAAKGTSLKLEFPDKSTAEFADDAEIELRAISPSGSQVVGLKSGSVVFNVLNGEDRFRVDSDFGQIAVRRAERYVTRFETHLPRTAGAAAAGRVVVLTGEISVESAGSEQRIGAGMQSVLRAGQPPAAPTAVAEQQPAPPRTPPERKPPPQGPAAAARRPAETPPAAGAPGAAATPPAPVPAKPAETLDAVVVQAQDLGIEEEKRIRAVESIPRIAKEEERNAARATLRELMRRDASERVRASALRALAGLREEDLFPELADAFQSDPAAEVKRAAIGAMLDLKRDEARTTLVEALQQAGSFPEEVRVEVVRAVGGFRNPEDVAALVGVLRGDESVAVRGEAAAALGSIRDQESVSALLEVLRDPDASLRGKAAQALRTLTGQAIDFKPEGTDEEREEAIRRFEEWWAENRESFQ
jgi:HEAT repeat protein/anti-sigma factor RsiW